MRFASAPSQMTIAPILVPKNTTILALKTVYSSCLQFWWPGLLHGGDPVSLPDTLTEFGMSSFKTPQRRLLPDRESNGVDAHQPLFARVRSAMTSSLQKFVLISLRILSDYLSFHSLVFSGQRFLRKQYTRQTRRSKQR